MTGNAAPELAPAPPEGLAWLGRLPDARAGWSLRLLAAVGRFAAVRVCGLRFVIQGREHAPRAGTILACATHRSWIDAPLVVGLLPLEPRIWYLGSGAATFRARWRERLMRQIGGILPVYRGGLDLDVHVASARAVLDPGAVFGIFPEGSRAGEEGVVQPFRRGLGLIGLRTGAPITPAALAGTKTLYRGRRTILRLLPPVSALELAGLTDAPVPGSGEELAAARRATAALQALLAPHVAELAATTTDPPGVSRHWTWMTTLFR